MPRYKTGITRKTTKKYPRITAGPLRHQYLHRVVAAAMLGRDLNRDEEVDHKDRNKLNFHFSNLVIRGSADHGWVSAVQSYFMRHKDEALKKEWDEFMKQKDMEQSQEIAAFRSENKPWECVDGALRQAWKNRNKTTDNELNNVQPE